MGTLEGEILSIETVQKMSDNAKKIERLKRNEKILKLQQENLQKKYDVLEQRNRYTEKRNKVLEKVETYLPYRIKKIKELNKGNEYNLAVCELQMLADALIVEKNKINSYEEETI